MLDSEVIGIVFNDFALTSVNPSCNMNENLHWIKFFPGTFPCINKMVW